MSEWQPIETAPKDGTDVILLFETGSATVGHYYVTERLSFGKSVSKSEGWVWTGKGFMGSIDVIPTHWMPLPARPES